jgi:elongation factor P
MAQATEIRPGMVIVQDGELFIVIDRDHITPGNWRAYVQIKARNLKTGSVFQKRFRSVDKIETAYLEKKNCEYLYPEGDNFIFMDTENYEQFPLSKDVVGAAMPYVALNSQVQITWHEGKPIAVDVPSSVNLRIVDTEPGQRGNSVTNVFKPATLETGLVVKVPLHIEKGNVVRVSTETGEFQDRVNE